jgi:signal transduction histidine kinase
MAVISNSAKISVVFVSAILDMLYYSDVITLPLNLLETSLLIFALFEMTAMFFGTMREVEAATEAEQQSRMEVETLRRVNKLKEEFIGNLSHELQMPLTVVSGFAQLTDEMLLDDPPDFPKLHDNMRRVIEEADRMESQVVQLLDIAAIDSGKFFMRREPVDVEYLIRRVETGYFPVMNDGSNRLRVSIRPKLPNLTGDGERLLQVLINLVSNAVRHTKGGMITIEAFAENGALTVRVTDTGTGIAPELLPQLFERFPERRSAGGTGLGLYICGEIIRAHGGEIYAEGGRAGGAAVAFTIPLRVEEA